jgi:predicted esterase
MKTVTRVTFFLLIVSGLFLLDAGSVNSEPCYFWEDGMSTIVKNCSEIRVTGHSQGNHELDCTVIRPWHEGDSPDGRRVPYPVIGWANGWNFGNVVGEHTTEGYKPGLIEWALDGPYIVVAANQWSVQESDVLACVQWVIEEYGEIVDTDKIGLAGHSQGGGAVIKAGDGEPNGFDITTVIAMNPYGPAWVNPEIQDGPVLLLGGTEDTTTPTSSFVEVLYAVQEGQGGLLAELEGGTHNSEAWGVDETGDTLGWEEAQELNFGEYQRVTELWWDYYLNENARSGQQLQRLFDRDSSWKLW